jgi:2-polyprenyl-6-methoxyphenol hydroxylase-like FAD-dependent oxidoreductase
MSATGNETDVLIVGAGPVGLAMACELLRHSVHCRIIDQAAVPARTSRALGIHARTLEVFENMGVIEKVLAEGTKAKGLTLYDGDKAILRLSLQHIREKDSQYPFLLILPQSQTERVLNERLIELGGAVERARELLDIQQEDGEVIASVKVGGEDSDEREVIRARWLIGCDGAKSRVRKIMEIPFEGMTAEEEWLLADVDLSWNRTRETTHGWFTRDGLFAVFPLPDGQWRLIAAASQQNPQASLETFQRLLVQYTRDTRTIISNPTWMSNFKINYRIVVSLGSCSTSSDQTAISACAANQSMRSNYSTI